MVIYKSEYVQRNLQIDGGQAAYLTAHSTRDGYPGIFSSKDL